MGDARTLDYAHNSLAARIDLDVLYSDLLLALAAMPVQGIQQQGVGSRKPIGLVQVLAVSL